MMAVGGICVPGFDPDFRNTSWGLTGRRELRGRYWFLTRGRTGRGGDVYVLGIKANKGAG